MVAEGCACYSMHSSDCWYCTVMCTVRVRAVFRLKLSEGWGSDGGGLRFRFWIILNFGSCIPQQTNETNENTPNVTV